MFIRKLRAKGIELRALEIQKRRWDEWFN